MGCHFLLQGIFLTQPGIKPTSPALVGRFFTTEPPRKPHQWREAEEQAGSTWEEVWFLSGTEKRPLWLESTCWSKFSLAPLSCSPQTKNDLYALNTRKEDFLTHESCRTGKLQRPQQRCAGTHAFTFLLECFPAPSADHVAHRNCSIYRVALLRKSLLSPCLDHGEWWENRGGTNNPDQICRELEGMLWFRSIILRMMRPLQRTWSREWQACTWRLPWWSSG